MEVSTPQFLTGFKCRPAADGEDYLRMAVLGDMACDLLLGDSSPLYLAPLRPGAYQHQLRRGFEMMPGVAYLYAGRRQPGRPGRGGGDSEGGPPSGRRGL